MGYYPNNMYNPYYPNYYANSMHQNYGNIPQNQTQQSQQSQQNQQQITTQPPILQPANNSKITSVSNKEEATGASVDLIYGTPSFFYNKSNGEIYLKQFDVQNGSAIFKIYKEIQPVEEPKQEVFYQESIKDYEPEFERLNEGIDSLHRILNELKEKQYHEYVEPDIEERKVKGKKNA
jgi:hypothetical protein